MKEGSTSCCIIYRASVTANIGNNELALAEAQNVGP